MQGRDQDNSDLMLSDDLSDTVIGEFDDASLDDL